jgi:quercetin dioxygenase-like cupin family protein
VTNNLAVLICWLVASTTAFAQGAAADHPPAFKVEVDNPQVRVVRRYHAPHEFVPMHSHKDGVVVYLTEVRETSTDQDGTSREVTRHAGEVIWSPGHTHSLKNLADTPIEVIEIELKSAPHAGVHAPSRSRSCKHTADALNVALANRSHP